MVFSDRILICQVCRNRFLYTAHEQRVQWSETQEQRSPDRCPGCTVLTSLVARRRGTVKWYDRRKGYGFIHGDGCGRVFVHRTALDTSCRSAMRVGARVAFDLFETERGLQAQEVTVLQE